MRMWIAVLSLGVMMSVAAQAACENTVSVSGASQLEKAPDIAYIVLYVKGDGILMTDAVKNAAQKADEVIKAIRQDRPQILDVKSEPSEIGEKRNQYYSSADKDESPRPQVVQRLMVSIPPIPSLAYEIIDAALRAGAVMSIPSSTHYSGELNSVVVYGVQNAKDMEEEAKKLAFEDAKKNAESSAALAGRKLGIVNSVNCQSVQGFSQQVYFSGRKAQFPTKYIGISPEKIEINGSVTVTYNFAE